MYPTNNNYYVNIDLKAAQVLSKEHNIILSKVHSEDYENVPQHGMVRYAPKRLTGEFKEESLIEVGAKVYFHYHVNDQVGTHDGNKMWRCEQAQAYCYMKGNLPIMVNDHILIEPIFTAPETTSSGIIGGTSSSKVSQVGKVYQVPLNSKLGLEVNDEVIYSHNSENKIQIEGVDLFVMKANRDLLCKVTESFDLIPLNGRVLIEPLDEGNDYEMKNGIYVPRKYTVQKHLGKVSIIGSGANCPVEVGDEIIYDRRDYNSFNFNGTKYYALDNPQEEIWAVYD